MSKKYNKLLLRLSPEMKADLAICATALNTSRTELIRNILESFMDARGATMIEEYNKLISNIATKIAEEPNKTDEMFDF